MNKKQNLKLNNKEFCKKYLKTDWDGCSANDFFIAEYDANSESKYFGKPDNDFYNVLREISISLCEVFSTLAPLAFDKNNIVSFLNAVNRDKIIVPETITDKEKFIKVYMDTCKDILENINKQVYDFQRPKLS